jgi:uncharacterized membrane protein YphA (DoxX/SURF4 family)
MPDPAPLLRRLGLAALNLESAVGVIASFQTRTATLGLVAFTLLATVFLHPFWILEGAEGEGEYRQFMKNLGLAGGFLVRVGPFLARRVAQSPRGGRVRCG